MARLVSMLAENVKRLKFVQIDFPEEGVFSIGGDNDQGKTSLLDAIEIAVGGGRKMPDRPIRDGASKARIVLDCEDFTVQRNFTAKGTTLEVRGPDGKPATSPQALLDKFFGKLTLDPLKFFRDDDAKQAEVLRELAGVDLSKFDEEAKTLTETRRALNADVKKSRALYEAMPRFSEAREVVSVAETLEAMRVVEASNAENARARNKVELLARERDGLRRAADLAEDDVTRAEKSLDEARMRLRLAEDCWKQKKADLAAAEAIAGAATDEDTAPFRQKLADAEKINQKVAANKAASDAAKALAKKEHDADEMTERLGELGREKERALAAAKFPIEGLSFDDVGVLYNGVPLSQHGQATKMRVAVAIAFAQQPTIKLALIRDASLIGKRMMDLIVQLAAENKALVLTEVVSDKAMVVLEDGEVRELNQTAAE